MLLDLKEAYIIHKYFFFSGPFPQIKFSNYEVTVTAFIALCNLYVKKRRFVFCNRFNLLVNFLKNRFAS